MALERHILVCGASEDLLIVHRLQDQLNRRRLNVELHPYPLDANSQCDDAERSRRCLRRMLERVPAVVWLASSDTSCGAWLDWVVEQSASLDVRLIAMPASRSGGPLPRLLVEHADDICEADPDALAEALAALPPPPLRQVLPRPAPRRVA